MMPNDHGMTAELAGLQAAKGRGYAELIGADPEQDVLIIEELGAAIASSGLSRSNNSCNISRKPSNSAGRRKSSLQRWFTVQTKPIGSTTISNTRRARVTGDVEKVLIHAALDHIDLRRSQWRQDAFVLVHGDAHEHNTLAEASDRPKQTEPTGYKLVDPDGLFFEAAYDLGILLRNWIDAYRIAQPASTLTGRATWLAEQTQVSRAGHGQLGICGNRFNRHPFAGTGLRRRGQRYLDLGRRCFRWFEANDRGPARVDR